MYQDNAFRFDPTRLSEFALAIYTGQLQEKVQDGTAPDLAGYETPYKIGYVSMLVLGAQRIVSGPVMQHVDLLKFLLASGAPPDIPDIVGYTALNHVTMHHGAQADLARILLENGANSNHQTRYGGTPILDCLQSGQVESVDLLMEFGADLDIPDADGYTPRGLYVQAGPKIAAGVDKWLRKRRGEEALLDEKKCGSCGKTDGSLKYCGKCHTVKYCSPECQRKDWPLHKKTCRSFNESNTVTLIPGYQSDITSLMSTADITRRAMGIPTEPTPSRNSRASQHPRASAFPKSVVIKVQVPYAGYGMPSNSTADLLVYTKKRDFVCTINIQNNKDGYKKISQVVRDKGVGGAKAYFAAELKSANELVVKVDEVLAAQPF
ncbi:hypothetical protein EUX98_g4036 [Antrodiella citrinella]|uniref:MYND-type domain-containing protein n=1 Tax=Antrodiella citrinella TaxID=2447956 RepID=A0A4S4MV34_9APHY|nr:hypothetical protein EUX98_g4036 [Antrodiella citrinella]